MRLTITRDIKKIGRSDEWQADLERCKFSGIGHTRVEAIGSLVSANLARFEIDERMDIDPESNKQEILWTKPITSLPDGLRAD